MKLISQKEISELTRKFSRQPKTPYQSLVMKMKVGESLFVSEKEWHNAYHMKNAPGNNVIIERNPRTFAKMRIRSYIGGWVCTRIS